jgi:hypothetical protein
MNYQRDKSFPKRLPVLYEDETPESNHGIELALETQQ